MVIGSPFIRILRATHCASPCGGAGKSGNFSTALAIEPACAAFMTSNHTHISQLFILASHTPAARRWSWALDQDPTQIAPLHKAAFPCLGPAYRSVCREVLGIRLV